MSSSVRGRGGSLTIYLKHWGTKRKGVSFQPPHHRYQWLTYIKTLVELLLLLVYYAETEVNLVGLLKLGRHAHDLRKGLFGVVQGSIAIVQDTNTVPQLRFLDGK